MKLAYAALDPSRAVGVMGDKRVYGYVCGAGFPCMPMYTNPD